MKPQLIVTANAAHARLLLRDGEGDPLRPLAMLEHPDSRRKASELTDDRLGHDSMDQRPGGVSHAPRTDPRHKEHARFAGELAGRIDALLREGECGSVVLLASDPFLGALQAHLSDAARKALRVALPLDYTALDLGALERRLPQVLAHAGPSSS
jgi:protein required for attachment to host cells